MNIISPLTGKLILSSATPHVNNMLVKDALMEISSYEYHLVLKSKPINIKITSYDYLKLRCCFEMGLNFIILVLFHCADKLCALSF